MSNESRTLARGTAEGDVRSHVHESTLRGMQKAAAASSDALGRVLYDYLPAQQHRQHVVARTWCSDMMCSCTLSVRIRRIVYAARKCAGARERTAASRSKHSIIQSRAVSMAFYRAVDCSAEALFVQLQSMLNHTPQWSRSTSSYTGSRPLWPECAAPRKCAYAPTEPSARWMANC